MQPRVDLEDVSNGTNIQCYEVNRLPIVVKA